MKLKTPVMSIFLTVFLFLVVLVLWYYQKVDSVKGAGIFTAGVLLINTIAYFLKVIFREEIEHRKKIKDHFFNPLLDELKKEDNKYCRIGSQYSKISEKMVRLEPKEPNDLLFYDEVNSTRKYRQFLRDWKKLKESALQLNTDIADLFENIRIRIREEINLPHYCSHANSDEPFDGYICFDTFTKSIYEEIKNTFETERKQKYSVGISYRTISDSVRVWDFKWGEHYLVVSPKKEQVDAAQLLFNQLLENKKCKEMIERFLDKKKKTYDICFENVKHDLESIIKSIEME